MHFLPCEPRTLFAPSISRSSSYLKGEEPDEEQAPLCVIDESSTTDKEESK